MIEWLAPSFLYSVLKDIWRILQGRRRRLSAAQILEIRQKWKPLFEDEIWRVYKENLRKDVVIRDIKRLDTYPVGDDKAKGISPWFRVGLMATYHKGILVGLRWGQITKHESGWTYKKHDDEKSSGVRVILIGYIPYENIEAVDWSGDEYYNFPHLYCHFDEKRKEPYESLMLCEEKCNPGGRPFYVEVAPYETVRKVSKKLGIKPSF